MSLVYTVLVFMC